MIGSFAAVDPRVVVLPVDDSAQSERAFNYYFNTCWRAGDRLVLVHIFVPPELPSLHKDDVREISDSLKLMLGRAENARSILLKYGTRCDRLGIEHDVLLLAFESSVEKTLVNAVNELRPTLTVLGCRGSTKGQHSALGSISDYVVHHSEFPVVVVPLEACMNQIESSDDVFFEKSCDQLERFY